MIAQSIDPRLLDQLVEAAVRKTLALIDAERRELPDEYYSEAIAAERLGCPKHVLRDYRRRGEIESFRIGRRVMYRREALQKWITSRSSGGAS